MSTFYDMIGSTADGSSEMNASLDRKGGMVMSNRKRTSDMVGCCAGDDIVGSGLAVRGTSLSVGALAKVVGRARRREMTGSISDGSSEMPSSFARKGGRLMSNRSHTGATHAGRVAGYGSSAVQNLVGASLYVGAEEKKAEAVKEVKKELAKVQIDDRIVKHLKPAYAADYLIATQNPSQQKYLSGAVRVLLGMISDGGISSMVKDPEAAKAEFGELGYLHRAIGRRLTERGEYMKHGWLMRVFGAAKEKKSTDL